MGNHRWNERDSEERGGRGWRGQRQGGEAGYNPAGPAQGDYAGGRGDEDRSWQSGQSSARPEDGYNDAGPLQRGRSDDRQGQAFGNPGYGHRGAYGDFDRQGYVGSESRTGYGNRPSRGCGGSQYGQAGGAYGEYGRDWGYQGGGRGDPGFGDPNDYVQAATDGDRQGSHRGKGPKDYNRSDDRIREDVNDRLTEDHHIDASNITVSAKDGEITLSGTVDSRFAKRHAEDLSDRISGVKHVQNNLRIGEGRTTGEVATTDATSSATSTARGSTSFS